MSLIFSRLEKRITKLQKKIAPIAAKIEQQRHLASIKNGVKDLTFILLVGSFFLMVYILCNYLESVFGMTLISNMQILRMPIQLTFGMLSIYAAITVSYRHAKSYDMPILIPIFSSILVTGIAAGAINLNGIDLEQLNSKGFLLAILLSLLIVEIYNKFLQYEARGILRKVPEGSIYTMKILFPIIILSSVFLLINDLFNHFTGYSNGLDFVFSILLSEISSIDTPIMVFIIVFIEMLFWYIGINGYAVLASFVLPISTFYLAENVKLTMSGQEAEYIFTPNFWDYFASLTGSGLVGALVVLALFSKLDSIRSTGKTSVIPSIFSISEPILYGLPICFNIYLFIPFVIGTPILATLQWYVFKWGWVNIPIVHVADAPTPFAQVISTMDFRAIILILVIFILAVAMYYPFFKMYEKSVEKQKEKEQDSRFDDLDLDF
ncbi:PTS sugar transporter subunit IIC [Virgibacillus necropolis]|uniref:Permease IIC component n=1 Tax=Virgibacillus necropolis TaxID=163877 RepID=A0A221M9M3_9BACI|nr:PTS transporter subunit EIIC [Virgibacillus necropolis]ASN04322.1 PTS beta-glucoside transporter subunit IIC [Virgibacillus necropolis]